MAYPDGTTVIRYYPVETSSGYNEPARIGLGLWFSGSAYNPGQATLASVDGDTVEWSHDDDWWYVSSLIIPAAIPGGFVEKAFVLVTEDSEIRPITIADLPMDLYLSRDQDGWPGGYAGGVIQVGIYQNGEFSVMASFQITGWFFDLTSIAPGGWEQLPPFDPDAVTESSPPTLRLAGNFPVPAFWTQLKQAVEV